MLDAHERKRDGADHTPHPDHDPLLAFLVDLDTYPIHVRGTPAYDDVVARVRKGLEARGCSVVPGFLREEAIRRVQAEARSVQDRAHRNDIQTNAYSTSRDPSLPDDHPVNLFMERTNAFVPTSEIPREQLLRRLYHAPTFQRFVADCLGKPVIHEYADPYAALVLNVLVPGGQHPWHYDTNEFIVSTLVQGSEEGGVFEYCPDIRSPGDEGYERVGRVIRDEDRSGVRELRLRPGDLQLFEGRFALHRVTRVEGDTPRITAIFAYTKEPGVVGKPERTQQLFGRVDDTHRAAADRSRERSDGLID